MISFYRLKALFSALAQFREINRNQEAVYHALISYHGRKGCFPSHATLAVEAGVCERTVRNALREARLRGWIDWSNQRYGRRQTSNHYRFTISSDYINKVLGGIRQLKEKSAAIQDFFRRQNLPGSPYYYIKKEARKLWITIEKPEDGLSSWQRLYQENPEAALAQFRAS